MKKIVTIEEKEERKRRIAQIGGFGNRRTQVVPDPTKYTRKVKHKKA